MAQDRFFSWIALLFLGLSGLTSVAHADNISVENTLDYDHALCGPKVAQLLELDREFVQKEIHFPHPYFMNNTMVKNVHDFLFSELGPKDPCFLPVAKAYILDSLLISETDPSLAQPHSPNYVESQEATYRLTAKLLNTNRIQILTPDLRGKLRGAGWTELMKKRSDSRSPYRLRGAYACGESMIYLDPEIAPLDLSGNLRHELDHFIRDRQSAAPGDHADWKSLLLNDEVLALATGDFNQLYLSLIRIQVNYGRAHKVLNAILSGNPNYYYGPYVLGGDNDLFSANGPFSKLYGEMWLIDDLSTFMQQNFFSRDAVEDPKKEKEFKQIYSAVGDVYFTPKTALSSDYVQSILEQQQSSPPPGLYSWSTGQAQTMGIDQAVQSLLSQLDQASPQCQALSDSRDTPDVQSFIGTHMSAAPGEAGVKGGEAGVKGGEAGVKGGESGVKGGEAGVKGDEPIRACLLLGEDESDSP
jgi:hypothetical protein